MNRVQILEIGSGALEWGGEVLAVPRKGEVVHWSNSNGEEFVGVVDYVINDIDVKAVDVYVKKDT